MGSTLQKEVQLGLEEQLHLHDLVCLWIYVREKMSTSFTGEVMERHDILFQKGYLGIFVGWLGCKKNDWSPKMIGHTVG